MNEFQTNELHAEKAVIGSLLLDDTAWDEVGDYLQPSDFSTKLYSDVFSTIQELISNGISADIICVSQCMDSNNSNDILIQLSEIARSQFTSKNIKYYADIVKQKSIDRQIIQAVNEIAASVQNQNENRLDFAQMRLSQIDSQISPYVENVAAVLNHVLASIDERQASSNKITGLPTGFSDLDKIIHGFHGGDLIILAGRPGKGKTVLALNIAESIAFSQQSPIMIFSLEMSKAQLVERLLSSVAKIDANHIKSGQLTESEFEKISAAVPRIQGANIFLDDRALLSVSDIRSQCRRIKREHGLSLVIIDYITLMAGDGENETIRIGNISRGLKMLARDLNVPVIAISQLNRSVEYRKDKQPCMADLRQSGAIEQDADLILFITRDESPESKNQSHAIADIIIAKHRNGETGSVKLAFNGKNYRFADYIAQRPVGDIRKHQAVPREFVY